MRKPCSMCAEAKALGDFPPDSRRSDGRGARCRECQRRVMAERRAAANPKPKPKPEPKPKPRPKPKPKPRPKPKPKPKPRPKPKPKPKSSPATPLETLKARVAEVDPELLEVLAVHLDVIDFVDGVVANPPANGVSASMVGERRAAAAAVVKVLEDRAKEGRSARQWEERLDALLDRVGQPPSDD